MRIVATSETCPCAVSPIFPLEDISEASLLHQTTEAFLPCISAGKNKSYVTSGKTVSPVSVSV